MSSFFSKVSKPFAIASTLLITAPAMANEQILERPPVTGPDEVLLNQTFLRAVGGHVSACTIDNKTRVFGTFALRGNKNEITRSLSRGEESHFKAINEAVNHARKVIEKRISQSYKGVLLRRSGLKDFQENIKPVFIKHGDGFRIKAKIEFVIRGVVTGPESKCSGIPQRDI